MGRLFGQIPKERIENELLSMKECIGSKRDKKEQFVLTEKKAQ